ncbi:MAG: DUF6789 family protein [Gammaproteobacteria bacterium]
MNMLRGFVAGFVATLILSALMLLKGTMGLMPDLNVIKMLGNMMGAGPATGWLAHFMIGSVAWGPGFSALYQVLPGRAPWQKGMVFAAGAWLAMMVLVMPMAGAGFFGARFGMAAPVMTLVLHMVFGFTLGLVHGRPAEDRDVPHSHGAVTR